MKGIILTGSAGTRLYPPDHGYLEAAASHFEHLLDDSDCNFVYGEI